MWTLISTLCILIIIYLIADKVPFLAGILAVIPVKIIGAALIAHESNVLIQTIEGMLIGQFIWGFILLGVYLWLR